MKILVINGSPKKDASDTMKITRAFLDGMNDAASQKVKIIHAVEKDIKYCKGCFTCMHNGGKCVYNDEMKEILDEIVQSDLLLFSYPLYAYGMPAPLKAVLDRTLPLTSMTMRKSGGRYEHVEQQDLSKLRYMMICGCGFPNSRKNFEPAVQAFQLAFSEDSTIITMPENPMFSASEADVVTKPRLSLVRKAGRQYAENGKIEADLLAQICSPMIPEETYVKIVNGEA